MAVNPYLSAARSYYADLLALLSDCWAGDGVTGDQLRPAYINACTHCCMALRAAPDRSVLEDEFSWLGSYEALERQTVADVAAWSYAARDASGGRLRTMLGKPADEPLFLVAGRPRTANSPPWETIPAGRDREYVRCWHEGLDKGAIGRKFGVTTKTVENRITDLRKTYGQTVVPYARGPRGWNWE